MTRSDNDPHVLVLYYSPGGTVAELANVIARGVGEVDGMQAKVRTVPPVSVTTEKVDDDIPDHGPLYASHEDLAGCDALIIGCPTHFGNMPAAMKHFIDSTTPLWMGGKLAGKPGAVFSASTSLHGGQETTLMTMMLPLLHHGMFIVGLPYTETALYDTRSGGSPYGASRFTPDADNTPLSDEERELGLALGKRVAGLAAKLSAAPPAD